MKCHSRKNHELAQKHNSLSWNDVDLIEQIESEIIDCCKKEGLKPTKGKSGWEKGRYEYPRDHAVYILKSDAPKSAECLKAKFREVYMDGDWDFNPRNNERHFVPEWGWAAWYSDERYYVGYSQNPYKRIGDHVETFEDGSMFTYVFPVHEVHKIHWFDNKSKALDQERKLADLLGCKDGVFAFQS